MLWHAAVEAVVLQGRIPGIVCVCVVCVCVCVCVTVCDRVCVRVGRGWGTGGRGGRGGEPITMISGLQSGGRRGSEGEREQGGLGVPVCCTLSL